MIRLILSSLFISFSSLLLAQLDRQQVQVILDQQYLSNLKIEDLDGDGDQDIIGSRTGYNGNYVTYFNLDGQGNYGPPISFGDTTWWGNSSIELNYELGDMDNDGDLDLVPGRFAEGDIPYYTNDGNGSFSLPGTTNIEYYDAVSDHHFFRAADLDNDDQLDVVIYRSGSKELHINQRIGSDDFFVESLVHESWLNLSSPFVDEFLLFDYDLDGDLDYALLVREHIFDDTDYEQLHLYLFEQTCSLCFEEKLSLLVDQGPYYMTGKKLVASDLNGDLFPDLFIQYQKSDFDYNERAHLRIYQNLAGGETINLEQEIMDVSGFATVDYDLDGQTDLFLAISSDENANSGSDEHYYWYENTGNFSFIENLISEAYSGDYLVAKDLNQDEIPDLISLRNNHTGTFGVREGQADLSFADYRTIDLPIQQVKKIAPEDWDNDGDTDLLFFGALFTNGANYEGIYRANNEGNGVYSHPYRVYTPNSAADYQDFVDINLDGRVDAIGLENMAGLVVNRQLIYTTQQADGSWSEGAELIPDSPLLINDYTVVDGDNDGDPDVLVCNYEGEIYLLNNSLNSNGTFNIQLLDISYTYVNGQSLSIDSEDFNHDGIADLLLLQNRKLLYSQSLHPEPEYAPWDTISMPDDIDIISYHMADFTADGYQDILAYARKNGSYTYYALAPFDATTERFTSFKLVNNDAYGNSLYQIPIDFDNDGATDMISGNGFRMNIGNGTHFSSGYIPSPLEDNIESPFLFNAISVDIDNDGQNEIISGDRSLFSYSYDFLNRSTLAGRINWDTTAMCSTDTLLPASANWSVSIDAPIQSQLATSNNEGRYGALLPEIGAYTIAVLPPSGYWAVCPADTTITVLDSISTFELDFAAEALVDCPLVVIDMSSTSISQCFHSTVSIGYENAGTAVAENAVITLSFDARLSPLSSEPMWTSSTDTTLIFEYNTIDVGERGFIRIQLEPDCENLVLDEEVCFQASVTPNELCEEMLNEWDGANLEAEALCEDGILSYRITNTGEGAMAAAESYFVSIVNDDIVLYLSGEVILEPGESESIPLPESEDNWLLRVGQTDGHPYPLPIILPTDGCGIENMNTNILPNEDGNPFEVNLCRTVIGPYDPNDKAAQPIGLGETHDIERSWAIDYTIQFQNVGSDRARTVILHDQLSDLLDLATFEPGPASHEYEWVIVDERLLIVTFPEINLLDSTSNEAASQGFFSFRIQPKSDAQFDSVIENNADIYFDFNPPIRTSTVFHTLRKPVIATATQLSICPGDSYQGMTIDQDTIIEMRYEFTEYDSVHWHHIRIYPPQLTEIVVSLEEAGWWEGIYVEQDTSVTQIYENMMGCDSTVVYHLQLLTNTTEIGLAQAIKLHPNPSQNFSQLNWTGITTPEQIIIYNAMGQQIDRYSPTLGSKNISINTTGFPAGSYQIRLFWKDKSLDKILQVVR